MSISFIKNLLGVKADQAVAGAIETVVKWDPQAATEAELLTMEENLDKLGRSVAKAQADFEKEKREADQIRSLASQRMAAAEILNGKLQGTTDPAVRAGLEKSLGDLVQKLEEMREDVEREVREADEAEDFLRQLQANFEAAGSRLKSARSALEKAQRDMKRAEQQKVMAEDRAAAARQAAGLSGATSINVALKAMQDVASKAQQEASAANAKARLLAPTDIEKDDANIAEAMQIAAGGRPAALSLSDRLAALRGPAATPALAAPTKVSEQQG